MRNKRFSTNVRRVRRPFTLMEVIVAMAIFAVMMTILLNFFVGTQKLWSGADGKNELYADARVAMDLISSTLQSQFYDHGSTMFLFGSSDTKDDAVFFPVKMPADYGSGESLYYLSILWRKADRALYLRTLGRKDDSTAYKNLFSTSYGVSAKATLLRDSLGYAAAGSHPSRKIIDGVLSISFLPIHAAPEKPAESDRVKFYTAPLPSETSFDIHGSDQDVREVAPFGVQISMQMLSKQHFQEWQKLGVTFKLDGDINTEPEAAKAFRLANTRQFDRIVYLGFK